MSDISTEIPLGNHNWIGKYSSQLGAIIWTCECGVRTVFMDPRRGWVWTDSLKRKYDFKLPISCAEYKMNEALE